MEVAETIIKKDFDLQRAIAGDPIITRDGRKVLQFSYFPKCPGYKIVVHIEGNKGVDIMPESGRVFGDGGDNPSDLFMACYTKTFWLNIEHPVEGQIRGCYKMYTSEENANKNAGKSRFGNKAFKIVIEE